MINKIQALFKLIRVENLLFIVLIQLLIRYALFEPFEISMALADFQCALLITATVFIAAGGYIINSINDTATDAINKPEKVNALYIFTEKTAYNLFIILNVAAVGIGFYLANFIEKPAFLAVFIGISALLFIYSSYLKYIPVIKNLTIAILAAFVLIIMGIFDLMPAITPQNIVGQRTIFAVLLDYAFFAGLLTFIREIVKDMEDIDGDNNAGIHTLPILIGRSRSAKIAFVLGILGIVALVFYMYQYLYQYYVAVFYFLLLVIAPLLIFCIKILSAKTKNEYAFLSKLLKWIMFFGILSMAMYPFLLNAPF